MKNIRYTPFLPSLTRLLGVLILVFGFSACKEKTEPVPSGQSSVYRKDAGLLMEYLAKQGNHVNRALESGIKAEDLVFRFTDNTAVIDLRSHTAYLRLHIPGSQNIPFERLDFALLQNAQAFRYREIVLVCENGRQSAYTAALLQQAGVTHAHWLEGGISSWNTAFPKPANAPATLVSASVTSTQPNALPLFNTAFLLREDILNERIRQLFREGKAAYSFQRIQATPIKQILVFYGTSAEFAHGFPAGSIHLNSEMGKLNAEQLSVLPADQSLLVLATNPEKAAALTAGLRLLGYKAQFMANDSYGEAPIPTYSNRFPVAGYLADQTPGQLPASPQAASAAGKDSDAKPKSVILKPVNNPVPEGC